MIFRWIPRSRDRWRARFALLPTKVGALPSGEVVKVWGEKYYARYLPSGSQYADHAVERRPKREIPGLKNYGPVVSRWF